MGTVAPAMMPTEDLEAAIAELPAKKGALREAFDSLAANSPYPLPFTWEDLDAHVSSVESSISRRFSQLRALEAARPARTSENKEGANEVGEEEEDVEEEEEEVVEEEEEEGEEEEEEEEVEEEEEEVDMQMQEADGTIGNQAKKYKEGGEDNKRDAGEENNMRDADEEAVTTKVSAGQGKEAEGEEELDGYAWWDGEEQDTEEEEMVEKMTKKQRRGRRGLPAGGIKEFAEACGRMDAGTLVEIVTCFRVNKKLLFALHHAPDPAALVLQVVKLLLSSKDFRCSRVWGKCVWLFRWLSMNSAKHSADTTEQAKLVAKDWKEMISRPECCGELESLARGLLQFLISYNIVSEFNIHEIISIFAMVPRKGQQKKKNNTDNVKLCEDLGLADRATGMELSLFLVIIFFSQSMCLIVKAMHMVLW
jgi:hypothetical protein